MTKKLNVFGGLNDLFDIAQCKCYDRLYRDVTKAKLAYNVETMPHRKCTCPASDKIPEREWEFYLDQNLDRRMFKSTVDPEGSQALVKDMKRAELKSKEAERLQKQKEREKATFDQPGTSRIPKGMADEESSSDDSTSEEHTGDKDYETKVEAQRCNWNYPKTISFAQRNALSLAVICGMINMVLRDLIITDQTKYVSIKRVRNMLDSQGKKVADEHAQISELKSIAFDGKKNKNIDKHSKTVEQENITVISEPEGTYLHHFSPESSKGVPIGKLLYDTVLEYQSQDSLLSIGADGTSVNTSPDVGAIRTLEFNMSKCLQWVICMLHFNELPFKALFKMYDGKTSGPKSTSGPIGKAISEIRNKMHLN